jgi:hypothetical protein
MIQTSEFLILILSLLTPCNYFIQGVLKYIVHKTIHTQMKNLHYKSQQQWSVKKL